LYFSKKICEVNLQTAKISGFGEIIGGIIFLSLTYLFNICSMVTLSLKRPEEELYK